MYLDRYAAGLSFDPYRVVTCCTFVIPQVVPGAIHLQPLPWLGLHLIAKPLHTGDDSVARSSIAIKAGLSFDPFRVVTCCTFVIPQVAPGAIHLQPLPWLAFIWQPNPFTQAMTALRAAPYCSTIHQSHRDDQHLAQGSNVAVLPLSSLHMVAQAMTALRAAPYRCAIHQFRRDDQHVAQGFNVAVLPLSSLHTVAQAMTALRAALYRCSIHQSYRNDLHSPWCV